MKLTVFVLAATVPSVSRKNVVEAYQLEQTPADSFAQTYIPFPTCTSAPEQVK